MESRYVRVAGDAPQGDAAAHDVHAAYWPAPIGAAADARPIICVHGLGGSHVNWALAAPLLRDQLGAPVWAPDLAGFGRTLPADVTGRPRPATVPAQVGLLASFVRTVAPGRAALVLGNSMGGLIALRLGALHPELAAGLVLVNPALPVPLRSRPDPEVLLHFSLFSLPGVGERVLARRRRRLTPAEQVRLGLELSTADAGAIDEGLLAAHTALATERRAMAHTDRAFLEGARSVVRTVTLGRRRLWQEVQRITAPALHVQGARDRLVRPEAAEQLLRHRADWSRVRYDDLGHVPMIEDPQRFADDVATWTDKTLDRESAR